MPQNVVEERKLTELVQARRNRYYYGKLMDVPHFTMEQQYALSKQWLHNRTVIGSGVVCGLGVDPLSNASGSGVVIRAGLAIDGWGRQIIVPDDIPLVPLTFTKQGGSSQPADPVKGDATISICYSECLTDFAPAMVNDPDCGCGGSCEAGTLIETYCVNVLPGSASPVTIPCADDVKKGLAEGDIHGVLYMLSRSCAIEPEDPCLTLANVTVKASKVTIDDVKPRQIAPTNPVLVRLLSCLADCCASTPPAAHPLQVTGITVMSTGSLDPKNVGGNSPKDPNLKPVAAGLWKPPGALLVKGATMPNLIEVTLGTAPPLDHASVKVGNVPAQTSVWIRPGGENDQIIPMPGNVFRIYRPTGFIRRNEVYLMGGPAGPGAAPNTIQATDGTRLDGENPTVGGAGWHSGDDTQGGDFRLELNVS